MRINKREPSASERNGRDSVVERTQTSLLPELRVPFSPIGETRSFGTERSRFSLPSVGEPERVPFNVVSYHWFGIVVPEDSSRLVKRLLESWSLPGNPDRSFPLMS